MPPTSVLDRPAPTPAVVGPHRGELRARAMGSELHLIATGRPAVVDQALHDARAAVERLEQLWSRFLPCSDVSRLNHGSTGQPLAVAPETALLVSRGVEAWRRTGGRFDPSLLRAVVAAGYDRDFATIGTIDAFDTIGTSRPPSVAPTVTLPERLDPGCEGIEVDLDNATVALPPGVGFDPGGLGKGLAADLVASAALRSGVDGILVSIGGDLRCLGAPPPDADGAWGIAIPGPVGQPDDMLRLAAGGVATSTCLRRRWRTAAGEAHHLIDPHTGHPAARAARSVTVVAATACDAETLATAIAVDGRLPADPSWLGGAVAVVTDHDGRRSAHGPIEHYLVDGPGR